MGRWSALNGEVVGAFGIICGVRRTCDPAQRGNVRRMEAAEVTLGNAFSGTKSGLGVLAERMGITLTEASPERVNSPSGVGTGTMFG